MNLLLWFVVGVVVVYMVAIMNNQGRPVENRVPIWFPLVAWTVLFVFGAGFYYLVAVPKKPIPFDVRDVAKQEQKMLPPASAAGSIENPNSAKADTSDPQRIAPSGVVVVNETNEDVTVEGMTSTRVVKAHTQHTIGCMSADGTRLKIKGETYDFRFGGQPWWRARITSGGVTSEPLS